LEFNFNWKKLSAIAGLSWWNFYFRLYPGAIKTEQVIDFLKHLQRHVKGKLLIVWDGVATHRSRLVREYFKNLKGKIWVERLPAYAPELNPVEYLWGYWKQHELPNLCARDLWQLSGWAAHALRRIAGNDPILFAPSGAKQSFGKNDAVKIEDSGAGVHDHVWSLEQQIALL
jgi:transposase